MTVETRLYILGAAFLLFVASLVYFVAVLASARRERRIAMHVSKPLTPAARAEHRRATQALAEPVRTGTWRPGGESQQVAPDHAEAPAPQAARPAVESPPVAPPVPVVPDTRVCVPQPAEARPPAPVAPVVQPIPAPAVEPIADPIVHSTPGPAVQPIPASAGMQQATEDEMEWLCALADSLGEPPEESSKQPAPQPHPVAAPEPAAAEPPEPAADSAAPEPTAPAAPEPPAPAPAPAAPATREPQYRPIAPVEMRFEDGGRAVGVKAGTATHAKFQRLAADLLSELRRVGPP